MGEQSRSPVAIISWVLAGCVVFVGAGIWLTQPRSSAETSSADEEWEEEVSHDTFEDAWKQVWNSGRSASSTEVARGDKAASKSAKRAMESPKIEANQDAADASSKRESDQGAAESVAQAPPSEETTETTGDSPIFEEAVSVSVAEAVVDEDTQPPIADKVLPSDLVPADFVRPVTRSVSDPLDDLDSEFVEGPVEPRVVTLRLSGSVGGQKLSPKDGYTWGRIAYFLQRERKPPYFLVFPGGALSGVVGPPRETGPGEKQTIQGVPSMRPGGRLGSPLFVINILATVESAGAMTFYGRGVAQKYLCQVRAQVVYLGGEKPEVVDTFNVSESDTIMQGRVATGPPGSFIYYKAIEKLISRLRGMTYFK